MGNKIVDHSHAITASPVSAASTTSSFKQMFKVWDLVRLILDIWQYMSLSDSLIWRQNAKTNDEVSWTNIIQKIASTFLVVLDISWVCFLMNHYFLNFVQHSHTSNPFHSYHYWGGWDVEFPISWLGMKYFNFLEHKFNTLWPNDTMQTFLSRLVQEIAWCHQAPNPYLNRNLSSIRP